MSVVNNYSELQAVSNITDINEFSSVNDFLANGNAVGYQIMSNGNVINPFGSTATGQIVEFTPSTTGGKVTGVRAPYISEAESGALTIAGAGAYIGLSPLEILGGVFAGLGLGVVSYEANKDFWVDISNQTFQNFPGYQYITYDNIQDMSILSLFKDNTIYVPYEMVQSVANNLYAMGAFDYAITYKDVSLGSYIDYESTDFSISMVRDVLNNFYSPNSGAFGTIPLTKYSSQIFGECSKYLRSIGHSFSDYNMVQMDVSTRGTGADDNPFRQDLRVRFYRITSSKVQLAISNIGEEALKFVNEPSLDKTLGIDAEHFVPEVHFFEEYTWNIEKQKYDIELEVIGSTGSYFNVNCIGLFAVGVGIAHYINTSNAYYQSEKGVIELPLQPDSIPVEMPNNIPIEFPDWFEKIFELPQINPDYIIDPSAVPLIHTPTIPITIPDVDPWRYPLNYPQTDAQQGYVPAPKEPVVGDGQKPFFTPEGGFDPTGGYPIGGSPIVPPPVVPPIGGDSNALFTVYNPTKSQLDGLGSVLWSTNIIEQIVKMFTNNPMDAIISLQKIYVTPATGSSKNIKLGYIDTGVSSAVVTDQYVSINCGSVTVAEYFGDYRDYASSTKVEVFLPFIGFRDLKTEDVVGGTVNITYKVDVYTGTVLCNIKISKNGLSPVLYSFEGNCATNLPLTGADHSRQLASAVSVIGGAMIGGVGGATLAGAHAVVSGGAQASIQRSGNFSGNAGSMGIKTPYILVTRNIPSDALTQPSLIGNPANKSVRLSSCRGFTRVKEVHVENIDNATSNEKTEIESLLKRGVIIV